MTDELSATRPEHRLQSTEDLGEDLVALAYAAAERGRVSVLRVVNGLTIRVTVEVS